jgi:CBS domain-containing protein
VELEQFAGDREAAASEWAHPTDVSLVQQSVSAVMTTPVLSVTADTPLQNAVKLMSEHHISGLPVVDEAGALVGELTEQDLMVRESGFQPGPYVMLLDAVIYLRNPLSWDKEVHQVLGSTVGEVMNRHPHSCAAELALPAAARQLHEGSTQRLFVLDESRRPLGVLTRGDVVRALAAEA